MEGSRVGVGVLSYGVVELGVVRHWIMEFGFLGEIEMSKGEDAW